MLTYRLILSMIQLTTSKSLQYKTDAKYATRILVICVKNAVSILTQIKVWFVLICIMHFYKSDSIQKTSISLYVWDFLKGYCELFDLFVKLKLFCYHLFSVLQIIPWKRLYLCGNVTWLYVAQKTYIWEQMDGGRSLHSGIRVAFVFWLGYSHEWVKKILKYWFCHQKDFYNPHLLDFGSSVWIY